MLREHPRTKAIQADRGASGAEGWPDASVRPRPSGRAGRGAGYAALAGLVIFAVLVLVFGVAPSAFLAWLDPP